MSDPNNRKTIKDPGMWFIIIGGLVLVAAVWWLLSTDRPGGQATLSYHHRMCAEQHPGIAVVAVPSFDTIACVPGWPLRKE